ncbi:PQQ-binding-like beta-propeller repeat protein [Halomonas beimenensis]|uniref:Outer membrane protein assembly factor BamB, contains PQQ-like beta-propeller repeat n=1 Tax=Halomonas beimenensis TaxID=475662 RepID=A0A291P6P8_9GAMM|nr:PQQ-binding-like beta-propeller repeat protein [Halomonas beimenensis]ATJ82586.1 outer membrane protein assembly factor BamB, contains PQQ-like beta-propeller repeat [Halomonas beimenensis]
MRPGVLAMVLMVAGWLGPVGPAAAADYPENPLVAEAALFASRQGVMRFDASSDRPRWRSPADEQTFEPVWAGCRLLVGTSAGLVALGAGSGDLLWRRFADATVFSPTRDGEHAYAAGRDGVLRALTVEEGQVLWTRRFEGWIYPPALQAGMLVTGGQEGVLAGLDPATGAIRWRRDLGQELVYRPVAEGDSVYVTTFAGEVLAIDAASGAVRWRRREPVAVASPRAGNGRLYLPRFDGVLLVLDAATGQRLARRPLEDDLMAVHLDEEAVVATHADGRVVVLAPDDLAVRWEGELSGPPSVGVRLVEGSLLGVVGPESRLESRRLLSGERPAESTGSPVSACP